MCIRDSFYTMPSVIRKLMSLDNDIPSSLDLLSLKVIGSGKIQYISDSIYSGLYIVKGVMYTVVYIHTGAVMGILQ